MKIEEIPERLENFPLQGEKSLDLGYKADWFIQTAENGERIGNKDLRDTNYHRAFQAYMEGGWFRQALKIARIIPSESREREVLAVLKMYTR